MRYAEALELLKKLPEPPAHELTKPTKGAFGSFGSDPAGHSQKKMQGKPAKPDAEECPPVLHLVQCRQCQHFKPNANNPAQGLGQCGAGAEGDRLPWPAAPRRCATWHPTPSALLEICRAACDGLAVEPEELARWLMAQDDAQWMTPTVASWWAKHINLNGYP